MESYAVEYLNHVGMSAVNCEHTMVPCEICSCSEFTVIRDVISLGKGRYGKLPVQACNRCGYLMQNPRFDRQFYRDFYRHYYRVMIKASVEPPQDFIDDQVLRGNLLFDYLEENSLLPLKGAMLDVGCSSGGFLLPFRRKGWEVDGIDPDEGYVKYGRETWSLPITFDDAEEMQLEDNRYDLIIIMGSLEHVFDPNVVLEKCRKASKKGGLLVLEGRFTPLGHSKNYFNHNHHRYLRRTSIELIMKKHGWDPFITTDDLICGQTRAGNGYCIGKAVDKPSNSELISLIENGMRVDPLETLEELDSRDAATNLANH